MDERQAETTNFRRFLRILRRRRWILVVCLVLAPATTLALSLRKEKAYTASASLLFRDSGLEQALAGIPSFTPISDPQRESATNLRLVGLEVVSARTAAALGGGLTPGAVSSKMDIASEGESNLVSVSATDHSPQLAARLANTFAREFLTFRRAADRARIIAARTLAQREYKSIGPTGQAEPRGRLLAQRIEQLQTLASLQTGNAELAQPATIPGSPSSPRPKRDAAFGLAIGIVLGLMFAFLFERLDRRIRDPDEMSTIFGLPILAAIPRSRTLESGSSQQIGDIEGEAFAMMRANLRYFNVDREVRSVLITSAASGEGKSTVAYNLAFAAAKAGTRVLLLEADLRHPTLADELGLDGDPGLSYALATHQSIESVVQRLSLDAGGEEGPDSVTVDVVVAGALPPNPIQLIESEAMRTLLHDAQDDYGIIIVDTPPTSIVSDAIPLVTEVSGVIIVGRIDYSTREAMTHLRHQLENLEAPTLGVVVNAVRRDDDVYGYAYGYGYGKAYYGHPTGDGRMSVRQIEVEEREQTPASVRQGDDGEADESDEPADRGPSDNGREDVAVDDWTPSEPEPAAVQPEHGDRGEEQAPAREGRRGLFGRRRPPS